MWTTHLVHAQDPESPPELTPAQLWERRRIFYTLLDLKHPQLITLFRRIDDKRLPIDRAGLEATMDKDKLVEELGEIDSEQFYDKFCHAQVKWCPMVFSWHMDVVVNQEIIPFYAKTEIQPYRSGARLPDDDCARLYEIHVPEEFVAKSLQDKLISAHYLTRQHDTGLVNSEDEVRDCCHRGQVQLC
jgi:hypothetical protein